MQGPAPGVTRQAARNRDESAAQGAGRATVVSGSPSSCVHLKQVVRERAEHGPRGVGVVVAGGKVRQRLVFEIGDDLLDDGVIAVLGLDHGELVGAVGDQAEVPPVWEQLGLRANEAGAPDDQPPVAVDGLGDLRLPADGVVDVLPGALVDRLDCRFDLLDVAYADRVLPADLLQVLKDLGVPKPRVGSEQLLPVAPARSTRAASSWQKRSIPFCVFADPLRIRMCSTSLVSARVARIG